MGTNIPMNPRETSDAALIRRVQAGDIEAFAPLVHEHLPVVRAFVALRLPVPNVVDEITHETFVFGFRHIAEFEPDRSFRAWLRGIAWNLVRAELQRFAREQANLSRFEQAQLAGFSRGIDSETASDDAIFLEECLHELPPNMRRLVEERYRRGLTMQEIGVAMGRTVEWVRVTLFRIRKQLRECIDGKVRRYVS
jgi:RNA polymerase sigma-70 factor, ECF subfamily